MPKHDVATVARRSRLALPDLRMASGGALRYSSYSSRYRWAPNLNTAHGDGVSGVDLRQRYESCGLVMPLNH